MKKSWLFVLLISVVFLTGCKDTGKAQTLETFYQVEQIEKVEKVMIRDGQTGDSKTITEPELIDELMSQINDIVFTPQVNQEKRDGWRYEILLFDGDKKFNFTLNQIKDVYYDTNPGIYPIVDTFYKNLEASEE